MIEEKTQAVLSEPTDEELKSETTEKDITSGNEVVIEEPSDLKPETDEKPEIAEKPEIKNGDLSEADALFPLKVSTASLSSVTSVFGQSEEEIEREFKAYKAAKLFKKIDLDATGLRGDEEIKTAAENCLKYGFGGIVVLPQYILTAKKALSGGAEIIAAISYPYGEEIPFSTVKSALKAARRGANVLLVPVGVSFIKRGDYESVKKTFRKIVKRSKISVSAALECGALTADETERALKTLSGCGIKNFRSSTGFLPEQDEFTNLKSMRSAYKNGNLITATANTSSSADAVRLLAVADKIASKKAVGIACEIKEKLDIK